jgi:dipeptidyl aminopeptidase/acylaminoacyl peptidase
MLADVSTTRAGDTVRPGLEGLDWQSAYSVDPMEMALVQALKEPMLAAMNIEDALQDWFDGRLADSKGNTEEAQQHWRDGLKKLADLKPLPKADWGPNPDATLKPLHKVNFGDTDGADVFVVQWKVDNLTQYGVLVTPSRRPKGVRYPLLLYVHGAAFGVPTYAVPWLAGMAREGYVIIGPAFRGEDLFATYAPLKGLEYKCDGEIENLDGEVDDALSAVSGARKLSFVSQGKFGIIGHSFGAGAGLLVTARSDDVACMVSYDAWLTNPFRYYWDRMRRGANNWLSWADFCNQPVADQLAGLMTRSIVHHADRINCPLLMFIGGAYEGSVFHLSHEDLIAQLEKYNNPYTYDVVPDGGHNFVLDYGSEAATYAYRKHMEFLRKHLPPVTPPEDKPEPARNTGAHTAQPDAGTPATEEQPEQTQ